MRKDVIWPWPPQSEDWLLNLTIIETPKPKYVDDTNRPWLGFSARVQLPDGTPISTHGETPEQALVTLLGIWRSMKPPAPKEIISP